MKTVNAFITKHIQYIYTVVCLVNYRNFVMHVNMHVFINLVEVGNKVYKYLILLC